MLIEHPASGKPRNRPPFVPGRLATLALLPIVVLAGFFAKAAEAPVAVGTIDDVMMFADDPRLEVNFYGVFSNRPTDCTAESSNEGVLRLEHEGYDITLIPVGPAGTTTVTVVAWNDAGEDETEFTVTVKDRAPEAVGELGDLALVVGDAESVNFTGGFTGTNLVYSAVSDDDRVATVSADGTMAVVQALAAGAAEVTVTASNTAGSATLAFRATVADIPPTVAQPLDDIRLTVGETASVDFAETFTGTDLSFSMTSEASEAATVALAGGEGSTIIDIEAMAHGDRTVTVTASNSAGSASETFTVTVSDQTPMAVGELAAVTLTVGDSAEVDFADAFTGNALTYAVTSSAEANATATLSGETVTLTALVAGSSAVTVTASNAAGSAMHEFMVTVEDQAPAAVGSLPDLRLTTGGDSETVETSGAFSGTALTYSVASEGDAISVTQSGSQVTVSPLVEGWGTVTVTATNTAGAASQTFRVTVSTDATETSATERSLAAIGASTLSSVQSAIGARFRAARSGATAQRSASQGSWQGRPPGLAYQSGISPHATGFRSAIDRSALPGTWRDPAFPAGVGGHQAAASEVKWEPPAEWTFWGHADRQSFDASAYDGGVSSVYFGADADFGERWMAGFAVSSSSGEADYEFAGRGASGTGTLDTELTSVLPYVHVVPSEGSEVWAVAGAGWGDVSQTRSTTAQRGSADLSMWMASLGGRRIIASADAWNVSLLGDTSVLELQTDGGVGIINDLEVGVARQRAGMEAARLVGLQGGGSLSWFGQVAARHDSGDGETGAGGELIGGVRFDSGGRLSLEAKARLLAMHAADDYEEGGFSLSATVRPAADGTGTSLTVAAHSGAGMKALSATGVLDSDVPDFRNLRDRSNWGMAARIGRTLTTIRQGALLTPFAELDVASERRRTMLGVRYDLRIPNAPSRLNLELATGHGHDHFRGSGNIAELRGALRF